MKAMVVSPVGGRVPSTRGVLQHSLGINGTRRDLEAEEVAAYLTKLRSLVPDMPRKRKLSKLEVIQRVIEYICDLQTTLEETNTHQESSVPASGIKGNGVGQVSNSNTRQPLQPLLNASALSSSPMSATGVPSAGLAER
ncbi:DNA-binding protein inhibitor ID-3 [Venturia canescens]|uniref:DNA-binding protein inhibitor ID-3 n=1 Tax=Venturia canescens TaxID=32260 RepID=UPI001C9C528F|nr:DNA-binding protein inhibitor ID-3 [Venturia canescens]